MEEAKQALMEKKKKKKSIETDSLIPPQNNYICGSICICQMICIFSCVSIAYFTAGVYVPTYKAFNSGMNPYPVMCSVSKKVAINNCTWSPCNEWCFNPVKGACNQTYVNLRNNGTSLEFRNCTNFVSKTCYIRVETDLKYYCNGTNCTDITGTFNCTKGLCYNITEYFDCKAISFEDPLKCFGKIGNRTCLRLTGLHDCQRGLCKKFKTPYNCNRRCPEIPTRNKNVILISGDSVYLSKCVNAINATSREEVWNDSAENVLMSSCYSVAHSKNDTLITATDCVNGSLLWDKSILGDFTNFTYLPRVFSDMTEMTPAIAIPERNLTIYNESILLINLEGCVNTLKDECSEFYRDYARDGSDFNAISRFPCYYASHNVTVAYQRFDLDGQLNLFLFTFIIPIIFLIASCSTLTICQRCIFIGDDSKMRCKYNSNEETEKLTLEKIELVKE